MQKSMPELHMPVVTTTSEKIVVIPPNFGRAFARACVRAHRVSQLIRNLDQSLTSFSLIDLGPDRYLKDRG